MLQGQFNGNGAKGGVLNGLALDEVNACLDQIKEGEEADPACQKQFMGLAAKVCGGGGSSSSSSSSSSNSSNNSPHLPSSSPVSLLPSPRLVMARYQPL